MARPRQPGLTARENQLMEIIWQLDQSTVEDIQGALPQKLAGSTIRTLLGIMQTKGYIEISQQGKANLYRARLSRQEAQTSALEQVLQRFFQGSADLLLARLVEDERIDPDELERLGQSLKKQQEDQP
ncbi:MAG: BlaI/MecI/CopY family transcriptional regulator [Candidatus Latescibacteria bacterium]|nr:BlaI/MecI/CopY family transcriptional regulator [Candidatus Latescibacterota bacterium]